MSKIIITASILSLLAVPAFAAEEGLFSKLEQGIKAEAHTQIQGAVGSSIKGSVPASVHRVIKPVANDLVKGAVNASGSAIKQSDIKNVEPQGTAIEKANTATSEAEPAMLGDPASLTAIPKALSSSAALRLCSTWPGADCVPDTDNGWKGAFHDIRMRNKMKHGILIATQEMAAWFQPFYNPQTGKLDMSKGNESQLRLLKNAVAESNRLVGIGLLNPENLAFRKCIAEGKPMNPKASSRETFCTAH